MILQDKRVVIYGGSGGVGSAVAHAFAREGAKLFIAARTLSKLEVVAKEITAAGSEIEVAQVSALEEREVEKHISDIVKRAGRIDILFNAIAMQDVQGIPLLELSLEEMMQPITIAARTQYLTARAVARQMVNQGTGVILTITSVPEPKGTANIGGFDAACAAIESLWRSFAAELGSKGIGFGVLRSPGSPDTPDVQAMLKVHAELAGQSFEDYLKGATGLVPVAVVASAAVRMAADLLTTANSSPTIVTCESVTAG